MIDHMRLILCLSVLLASSAWAADEAADRAAIEKVIATLNNPPGSPGLFADDFSDNSVLISLGVYRYAIRSAHPTTPDGQPTIHLDTISMCVSHEPMGEPEPCGGIDGLTPTAFRFVMQSVRLLTPDVALVDAANYRLSQSSPVMLVLRKEGDVWKIASLRVIAQPRRPLLQ